MSSFRINRWVPVLGMILALALLALSSPEPAVAGAVACDSIGSSCCECEFGECIVVEHAGIDNCTSEYCSDTKCGVEP